MKWGGYYLGSKMLRVTCFTPTGSDVPIPEPLTLFLFSIGLIGIMGLDFVKNKKGGSGVLILRQLRKAMFF